MAKMREWKFEQLEARELLAVDVSGFNWHNPAMPLDTNGDCAISSVDVLQVVNFLNSSGGGEFENNRNATDPMVDVNRDGFATAIDALLGINFLNSGLSELIAYEGFEYAEGVPLVSSMGAGNGFLGPWRAGGFNASSSDHLTIAADSLASEFVTNRGGRLIGEPVNGIGGAERDLIHPLGLDDTTRYVSYLIRPEQLSGWFGITFEQSEGENPELFFGFTRGPDAWVVENRGGQLRHDSPVSVELNETVLLVLEAEFRNGMDTFKLYVNPTSTEDLGSPVVKTDQDMGLIRGLGIYSRGGFSLDEIRVGTTLQSVLS